MVLGFFNNKKLQINSPINGKLIHIESVKDDVFSKKLVGDGFAIIPSDGTIYSPVKGKVTSVFPTKHAITMLDEKEGIEVLLHFGIDTVELNGEGFDVSVQEGDVVDCETIIATVNLSILEKNNKGNEIMVVFPTLNNNKLFIEDKKAVSHGEFVASIKIQK